MRTSILLALALLALPLAAEDPAWIAYGPDGPLARTIVTSGGRCPPITIDGRQEAMRTHAEPAKHYEVRVCEAAIPAGAASASIGQTQLPVAKLGRAAKIAILGDTGCRRKAGSPVQDCSDPAQWPFAAIAATIARWDPDVVLHAGDYYYREAESCRDGKCTGTKYTWKRWEADFFTPAAPLLGNAPWVFTRGNHEMCGRAAEGWVRFLDPRNYVWEGGRYCASNLQYTPPYTVPALNLAVLDSSSAKDDDAAQAAIYAAQLGTLAQARPQTWLLLHHPFWAMDYDDEVTETMWTAWQQAGSATAPVSLLLTGHIHLLEAISFTDHKVPLFVAGNGGTALDGPPANGTGKTFGGRTIASFMSENDFGFIAATPSTSGWTFEIRNVDGSVKAKCAVTTAGVGCE